MSNDEDQRHSYSSPPCMAHELSPSEQGFVTVDAQTARDVARWRRAQRQTLMDRRMKLSVATRQQVSAVLSSRLDELFASVEHAVVALYWPIRGEPNLRRWMQQAVARGYQVLLPEVIARCQPLVFRAWAPGCTMKAGIWQIPVPAESVIAVPTHVIAPLVGFDAQGYRLGHGGGFYDRTLAKMRMDGHRPVCIGVGYAASALNTIYPQPHDIPMDRIVTEHDQKAEPL